MDRSFLQSAHFGLWAKLSNVWVASRLLKLGVSHDIVVQASPAL